MLALYSARQPTFTVTAATCKSKGNDELQEDTNQLMNNMDSSKRDGLDIV